MVSTVTVNPLITSNAPGSFGVEWDGLIQGTAMPDPATRFRLRGGLLASTETLPMWGGVGISETTTPNPGASVPRRELGSGLIARATNLTAGSAKCLTGFSVFDQDHAMINTPQSPVPLQVSGGSVHLYPLGSLARIAVACDPVLAAAVEGGVINQSVSWDFTNQLLIPFLGTLTISSGTYNNATGLVTLTMSAPVTFGAGDAIVVSSLTGTGAFASLNGTFTAASASGSTVTYNAAAGLGASTITGGSLTLGSGASVALPVKILDVAIGNSMTVAFASATGFATWNRSGTCALIQI